MVDELIRPGAGRRVRCRGTPPPRAARGSVSVAPAVALPLAGALLLAGATFVCPASAQQPEEPGDTAGRVPAADTVPAVRPYRLPGLEVEARRGRRPGKMVGFHRRRRHHPAGIFVVREEIERRDPRQVSDLLRGIAGVTPTRRPAGTADRRIRMDRTARLPGRPGCRVRFFVDGAPLPKDGAFRVDGIPPEDVQGIEVYRGVSEVPSRFRRQGDRCGVVVVWTREPRGDGRR